MPVEKYLMGAVLPPHLSPFSDNRRDQTYIPPEERVLMDPEYRLHNCKSTYRFLRVLFYLSNSNTYNFTVEEEEEEDEEEEGDASNEQEETEANESTNETAEKEEDKMDVEEKKEEDEREHERKLKVHF